DTRRIDVVFHSERNTMQRAAQPAACLLGVHLTSGRDGLGLHNRDKGIQFWVIGFDALQASLHQCGGRERSRSDASSCLSQTQSGEVRRRFRLRESGDYEGCNEFAPAKAI